MKKLIVLIVTLFAFSACATSIPPPREIQPQEVIVRVKSASDADVSVNENISRSMNIPYTEPEFEHMVQVIGDTVYFPIWSYISANDTLTLWKTIQVAKHKGLSKLYCYINSGGGSAFDGLGISDVIMAAQDDGFHITMEASGLIASAAVPIFAVGNVRIASRGTMFMIHQAQLFKFISSEKQDDLIAQSTMLQLLENRYKELVASKSKLTVDELTLKMARTTWFTAQEGFEWGLVDKLK